VMKLSHEEAAQTQQLCVQWLPSGDPQQEAATDSATADTSPGEPSIQPTLQLGGSPSASPARRRLLHLRVQKPATVLDIKVAVAREASEVLQGIELYLVSGMNCEITRVLRNDEAVEGLLTGGLTLYGQGVAQPQGDGKQGGRRLVRLCHYEMRGQLVKRHGAPLLAIVEGEVTAEQFLRQVAELLHEDPLECVKWGLIVLQGGALPKVIGKPIPADLDVKVAMHSAAESIAGGVLPQDSAAIQELQLGLRHAAPARPNKQVGITINAPRKLSVSSEPGSTEEKAP